MRYTKINPKAVSRLREKIRVTQQELAARVGCSLSAVQFWEAGRSSPRGYRLRRLIELCPDDESRSLFFATPAEEAAPSREPPKVTAADHTEWKSRYLDPNFLRSLSIETRRLYSEAAENILRLSRLKVGGNQVAAEGLHSLAEAIQQAVGMSTDTDSGKRGRPQTPTLTPEPEGHAE
jgi:transcriptional regulator with XRE-family HTH domain